MTDLTTDEEIDAALERAKAIDSFPRIVEAAYRPEPGLEFLMLRLSDGRRLLIPREELSELKNATPEQAVDLRIGTHGVDIWWPQLDDGLYLPDFLGVPLGQRRRWGCGVGLWVYLKGLLTVELRWQQWKRLSIVGVLRFIVF